MLNPEAELVQLLEDTAELANDLGEVSIRLGLNSLRTRFLAQEWVMLLLGETSSGKSTWVNSLLGEPLLPTAPGSTTSQVVEVRFQNLPGPRFERIGPDGSFEALTGPAFQALCIEPGPKQRLRVWWPIQRVPEQGGVDRSKLLGLVLFDTPGYNACLQNHVDLLQSVLPEADAVIGMLNFDRGLTPQDVTFLKLVKGLLSNSDEGLVLLAVNRVPTNGGERRRAEMLDKVREHLGLTGPLHPIGRFYGEGQLQCWSETLWEALEGVACSTDRATRIRQHTLSLLDSALSELAQSLEAQCAIAQADEEELARYRAFIENQRALSAKAEALVEEGRLEMVDTAGRVLQQGRAKLWEEIRSSIEDSNRFTEASACAGYTNHLINYGMNRMTIDAETRLSDCHDRLVTRLDHLLLEVGELPTPKASLDSPALAPLRRFMARRGIKESAEGLFMAYLRRLGGQGGEKNGIINLAKKLLSKGGRAIGVKFRRPVYDSMGGLLKKLGFSASKAATVVGVVAIELASYLHGLLRWKQSLKGLVQLELDLPALDEPIEDTLFRKLKFWKERKEPTFVTLKREWTTSITDSMDHTLGLVQANFNRRVEVLEGALQARMLDHTSSRTMEHASTLETLWTRCAALQGEAK